MKPSEMRPYHPEPPVAPPFPKNRVWTEVDFTTETHNVSPETPVLTTEGFKPACELVEGDSVVTIDLPADFCGNTEEFKETIDRPHQTSPGDNETVHVGRPQDECYQRPTVEGLPIEFIQVDDMPIPKDPVIPALPETQIGDTSDLELTTMPNDNFTECADLADVAAIMLDDPNDDYAPTPEELEEYALEWGNPEPSLADEMFEAAEMFETDPIINEPKPINQIVDGSVPISGLGQPPTDPPSEVKHGKEKGEDLPVHSALINDWIAKMVLPHKGLLIQSASDLDTIDAFRLTAFYALSKELSHSK
jgi:hypothetical protein